MDRIYLTWCMVFRRHEFQKLCRGQGKVVHRTTESCAQDNGKLCTGQWNKTLTLVWAFFSPTGFVDCEAVKWRPGWLALEEQQRTTTTLMELYQTATFLHRSKSSLLSCYCITVHRTCTSVHLRQSAGFRL